MKHKALNGEKHGCYKHKACQDIMIPAAKQCRYMLLGSRMKNNYVYLESDMYNLKAI